MNYLQRWKMKEAYDDFFDPVIQYKRMREDEIFYHECTFIIKSIWNEQVTNHH